MYLNKHATHLRMGAADFLFFFLKKICKVGVTAAAAALALAAGIPHVSVISAAHANSATWIPRGV
jgi:hypothetical protein